MKVKVVDFGLSRVMPLGPSYVDPMYHQMYHLTDKSDVYNFSVALEELIFGKKAMNTNKQRKFGSKDIDLAIMAIPKFENGSLHEKQLEDNGGLEELGRVDGSKVEANGEIVVDLTEEMEEDHKFWANHAVIARILGINWSRKEIKSWVEEKWGNRVVVKFLPKRFFVVLFEEGSERDHILNQENWFANMHAVYI
ncbi:hypothetical protein SUGI_0581450 [Cryptomeria japonica]|nr:hypothetical protein SUGI_0581450 [Cryptomeria japonica]